MAIKSLIVCETMPGVEEITRYNATAQASKESYSSRDEPRNELAELMAALPVDATAGKQTFSKGQRVISVKGDLLGITGGVQAGGHTWLAALQHCHSSESPGCSMLTGT